MTPHTTNAGRGEEVIKTTSATLPPKKKESKDPLEVPEKAIQAALIRRLVAAGYLVIRVNSAAFKNDNGFYVRGYSVAGLSVSAGHPDICAYKGDKALFIEVKTAKGELSESQKKFHSYAAERGVRVLVCRAVKDLEDELGDDL